MNKPVICNADNSGRSVQDMNCFRPFEHWDRAVGSRSNYGRLCVLILYVSSSLSTG
jgi:hypothetical protein